MIRSIVSNSNQRAGSKSNAQIGREFELKALEFFESKGIKLKVNAKVPIGVDERTKVHVFDLGSEESKIIIECKSHKWTSGGNVPSAKFSVWNEAMLYFIASPEGYRKIMFVLKDYCPKRKETLAEYYIRTYFHLIPQDVEFWEYDEKESKASQIRAPLAYTKRGTL